MMSWIIPKLLTGLFFGLNVSFQGSVNCSDPNWVGNPHLNSQGELEATLETQCQISLDREGSISDLQRNTLVEVEKIFRIVSGPDSKSFAGLPSTFYQVFMEYTESGDKIKLNSDLHVATNQTDHWVYWMGSTHVEGTGNAGQLRSLSLREEMKKESAEKFSFVMTEFIKIKKPWYAPEGIFISEAKKRLRANFSKVVSAEADQLAKRL